MTISTNNTPFSFESLIRNSFEMEGSNPNLIPKGFIFFNYMQLNGYHKAIVTERVISYHLILNQRNEALRLVNSLVKQKSTDQLTACVASIALLKLHMGTTGDFHKDSFEASLNASKKIFGSLVEDKEFIYSGHFNFFAGWLKAESKEYFEAVAYLDKAEEVFRHHELNYLTATCISCKLSIMSRLNPDEYFQKFFDYYQNLSPYPMLQHRMLEDKIRVIVSKQSQFQSKKFWNSQYQATKDELELSTSKLQTSFSRCFGE